MGYGISHNDFEEIEQRFNKFKNNIINKMIILFLFIMSIKLFSNMIK